MTYRKVVALLFVGFAFISAQAQVTQPGDVVFGISDSDPALSIELVRGPASGTGTVTADIWNDNPFIQSMEFDNTGGISHNASGNLLGLNFGAPDSTGQIYSFSTTDASVTTGNLLGDTTALDGGLSVSRLSSLSVSPDNSKIAVNGYDRGSVIVYDYTPGDTAGNGGAIENLRESSLNLLYLTDTQGITWIDDNTVAAFATDGSIYEVDATTMDSTFAGNVPFPMNDAASPYTALVYNEDVSPYLYASRSFFEDGTTTNELFVLDPANGYSTVHQVDLSTSANTLREIALDQDGNLFFTTFGGEISVLQDVVSDPTSIADNSSTIWYTSDVFAGFTGLDVAHGTPVTGIDGDFDNDGAYGCSDVDALVADIANGNNSASFDLDGDGSVNGADLDAWLAEAGEANIGPGRSYLEGDANLDGVVDTSDFNVWNGNKFTGTPAWCSGDFSADGVVDTSDLNIWNGNKFTSSDVSAVPEPGSFALLLLGIGVFSGLRRNRRIA